MIPTRRLLLSDPSRLARDMMEQPVISVTESALFGEALAELTKRRLLALPVVDDGGRLTGVIDLSMFEFDLERRAAADEVFQMVGVHIGHERTKSLTGVLLTRFPWLIINIVAGIVAAAISHYFDGVLRSVVAVTFFVPLVLTLSESIAMQTVTMSLDTLHFPQRRGRSMMREVRIGMSLGVVSGGIVGLLAVAWLGMRELAVVLGFAILAAGAIGAGLGYAVPRLVHRWKLDPNIASGPAVLALTDVSALSVYFGLAAFALA